MGKIFYFYFKWDNQHRGPSEDIHFNREEKDYWESGKIAGNP
ncbi:MAG: hypothetical protein Q8918_01605 [Bacteroidota bacterium]|nr:hypothetical protein [Bacteroidota bacterium]MDP4248784.1 hypothetical protein [Bacteroidota bacterium]